MLTRTTKRALWALACLLLSHACLAQNTLTVESFPAVNENMTTFRFYVNLSNPSDRVSAVYGNAEDPMELDCPSGVYNNVFNTSWNASGINPAFLGTVPELVDDTYATIGLDGPATAAPVAGAADPSLVEDSNNPVTPFFLTNGATSMDATSEIGASWFVLNTASNGLPNDDGRVLVMQITTTGTIAGKVNVQVFPQGVGTEELRLTFPFSGAGTFEAGVDVPGCTDYNACNYDASANVDDGSCVFCNCGNTNAASYTLTVEESPAATNVFTRYRFYVNMVHPDDVLSAVYGNSVTPLTLEAPTGAFNSEFNSSWNASGLNPAFLSAFPDLVDDTYATIGLDGPASSSDVPDAADPLLVEDPESPLTPFFTDNFASSLTVDGLVGSSWFVLNGDGNALPNEDMRVMILQVTTLGSLSGKINVQVFPQGQGSDQFQLSFEFSETGTFEPLTNGNPCGCLDETALNFDPNALYDDGSCVMPIPGCLDEDACNFNPFANVDGGGCEFPDCAGVCGGDAVLDACGVCDGPGAIYECGCNPVPDGDCDCEGNQVDALGVCGGPCEEDLDGDGICDDIDPCVGSPATCCSDFNTNGLCDNEEVVGCTYAAAPNYNPDATMDDGSCLLTCTGDLNGDGIIQLTDLLDFLTSYGNSCN